MVQLLERQVQEPELPSLEQTHKKTKIKVHNIDFSYDDKTKILNDIQLEVKEGEFLVFMGPSGCGKSTLLRMIAGLEPFSDGDIVIDEKSVRQTHPDCGVVFQDYSLFPWLNAQSNVMLALKQRNKKMPKKELAHIAEQYLTLVNLGHAIKKYPGQMSGGMKQRAAIARALSFGSDLLLMDEPFGALDPVTRIKLQDLIVQISAEQKRTVVFVTHDVDEAIYLADRIIIFAPGKNGAVTKSIEVPVQKKGTNRQKLFEDPQFRAFRESLLNEMNEQIVNSLKTEITDGAGI
ncbi:ABC transporter ATP-binding protein [Solibacillus merdavium]|uniref:ABC transporter ATP-binding protein n=1 Tax=Solibacillus merdavium TaxID=2762218 RepID=A0ABR8XPW2_9BACL|nr:ABC transporter ATP-binding protein [Solibacillus merdavium]MBD8033982.1 ABC transporter ATP-binding protein [Solibacillus merdavium]